MPVQERIDATGSFAAVAWGLAALNVATIVAISLISRRNLRNAASGEGAGAPRYRTGRIAIGINAAHPHGKR